MPERDALTILVVKDGVEYVAAYERGEGLTDGQWVKSIDDLANAQAVHFWGDPEVDAAIALYEKMSGHPYP